jgi:Zn-dependent peptidase ImmA (M78 family)
MDSAVGQQIKSIGEAMATRTPKQVAEQILSQYSVTSAPVDVEDIATKMGAVVSYEVFKEDLSGVCVKEKTRTVIGVNSFHARTRQRFTIAHECGHLALEHKGEVFVDQTVMRRDAKSSQAVDRQEIEANQFAAELLMPSALVIAAVERRQSKKPDLSSTLLVDELAEEFQVSSQAMEYRLTNLGMFMPR